MLQIQLAKSQQIAKNEAKENSSKVNSILCSAANPVSEGYSDQARVSGDVVKQPKTPTSIAYGSEDNTKTLELATELLSSMDGRF